MPSSPLYPPSATAKERKATDLLRKWKEEGGQRVGCCGANELRPWSNGIRFSLLNSVSYDHASVLASTADGCSCQQSLVNDVGSRSSSIVIRQYGICWKVRLHRAEKRRRKRIIKNKGLLQTQFFACLCALDVRSDREKRDLMDGVSFLSALPFHIYIYKRSLLL